MQAPTTTEGGLAGRDPQTPACSACGATSPPSATFCWRCYQAFGAGPGRPDAWPPSPAGPTTWQPESAVRPRTSHIGRMAWVAMVVLGVAVAVAFVGLHPDPVTFPESFAGLTRATDGPSEAAAASFRTASDADGLDADMAFYAEGATPVTALAWIRAPEQTPSGVDEAFDTFADGFTGGYGGAVVASERLERTVDGVEYVCAPVGGAVAAGLCMWRVGDVVWVLVDVRPGTAVAETERLAVTAHDATA